VSQDSPASILFDELGNPVGVTQDGYIYRLQTENIVRKIIPTVSVENSTTASLAANGIFSGASEDVSGFVSVDITILADTDSANQGLLFEFSQDNITFDYSESFTILAGVGSFYSLAPRAKYFRLSYTNGPTGQTSFALSAVYYPIQRSIYIQNLDTDVPAQKGVEVVRSVIAAQKSGAVSDTYTNLQATNSGILRVVIDTAVTPPSAISETVQTVNATGTGTTFSSTLSPTVAGNTIIVLVMQGNGSAGATYDLSDTQNNSYVKGGTVSTPGVGQIDIWYSGTLGGPDTITANNFSQISTVVLQSYEVSGLLVSSESLNANIIITTTGTGTSLSVGPINAIYDDEFCIAAFASSGSSAITSGPTWTQDFSSIDFLSESKTQILANSITGTGFTTPSTPYVGLLATFFPALTSRPVAANAVGQLLTVSEITDGYNGPVSVVPPFTAATSADTALVVAISPNNPITIDVAKSSTVTTSSIAASLTNIVLLNSNSIRLGATIFNDSTSGFLYINLGAASSQTDFVIKLLPLTYYELPFNYTGEIDGVWSTAGGFARIAEFT